MIAYEVVGHHSLSLKLLIMQNKHLLLQILMHHLDGNRHKHLVYNSLIFLGPGFSSTSFESLNNNGTYTCNNVKLAARAVVL
jgi:hypothetical protein